MFFYFIFPIPFSDEAIGLWSNPIVVPCTALEDQEDRGQRRRKREESEDRPQGLL